MNRRHFITVTAGALVAAQFAPRMSAQYGSTEPRWDVASQLFGNAFDLLPKATEGKTEFVVLTPGKYDAISQNTEIYAVIHNNTDASAVITNIAADDSTLSLTYSSIQPIAQAGGYVLLDLGIYAEIAEGDNIPALTVESLTPEEAEAEGWYIDETVPLRISDFAVDGDNFVSFDITNESEDDYLEAAIDGLVMFFNPDGTPVSNLRITGTEDLQSGTTVKLGGKSFEDVEPTMPFLAGSCIYTAF